MFLLSYDSLQSDIFLGASQMWTSTLKKNYSYHICEIYSDNLAVCLYIKFSFWNFQSDFKFLKFRFSSDSEIEDSEKGTDEGEVMPVFDYTFDIFKSPFVELE